MDSLRKVYQYAEPNLSLVGWMGFLGFPTYFVVWQYLFPQPYENLPLRIACSLLFFGIIVRNKVAFRFRAYMHWYYQVVVTVCLPFFFFYMLLMNEWSNVWVMSFMAAIFLHILLVHITRIMFAQTFVGIFFATICAWASKDFHLDITMDWTHIPIFLFIYLFGNLFYFKNQIEHEAKVSIAKAFGAGIAHEMRNPLSGLCSSVDVIRSIVPDPNKEQKANYQLTVAEVALIREISDEAMKIIQSGNETIDLLLTSIDENRVSRSTFKKHTAKNVLENAIDSFSYKRATDRSAISLDVKCDFEFLGSDTLLKYVVYNLFKNAFHHRSSLDFHIQVTLEADKKENRIIITDNGSGISPEIIESIFEDFYTTGKSGNYGLGLPFCRKVMHSFGGDIKCISQFGEWSQFTMAFPKIDSPTVQEIKYDLIKLKSILLISNQNILMAKATELSRFMGYQLDIVSADKVLDKEEYEFEYDVIFVDLGSIDVRGTHLDRIESLLSFTEGRIVYLCQEQPLSRPIKAEFLPIWMETQAWLLNTYSVLERLLFDVDYPQNVVPINTTTAYIKRTILLVDDNESLRKFTAMLLEKQGFDVIQKEDGKQAIETLNTQSVDLILMDIEMPIMDGIEASQTIRNSGQHYSSVPIIAHTGDSSPVTLDKIESSGMSDFIVKPADKARLFDKIATWI